MFKGCTLKSLVFIVLFLALFALPVLPVLAQGGAPEAIPETSNGAALLALLVTLLKTGAVGVAVAWIIERAPGWNTPPTWLPATLVANWPRVKRWGVFVGAVALPTLIAVFFYGMGPEYLTQTGVWTALAVQGLAMWVATQAGHVVDPTLMRSFIKALIDLTPTLIELFKVRNTSVEPGGISLSAQIDADDFADKLATRLKAG